MRLRDRMLRRLDDPKVGPPTLFGISFLESTLVPIPIEIALVPLMASARARLWWIAAIALSGTIAGAMAGYAIGYFLFGSVGEWLLANTGTTDAFDSFTERLREDGFWVIVFVGISALPFKIASLGAGAIAFDFGLFFLATMLARTPRYLGLALLVHMLGNRVTARLKRHRRTAIITTILGVLVIVIWQIMR